MYYICRVGKLCGPSHRTAHLLTFSYIMLPLEAADVGVLVIVLVCVLAFVLVRLHTFACAHTRAGAEYSSEHPLAKFGGCAPHVELVDITRSHTLRLRAITADVKTMRWVGNGRPWRSDKVDKFVKYNLQEQRDGRADAAAGGREPRRHNYYWGVERRGVLIGVVGLHPITYDDGTGNRASNASNSASNASNSANNRFFVTIFLDRRETGRGAGSAALKTAVRKFRSIRGADAPVYADARADNLASAKMLRGLGFVEEKELTIHGKPYRRFKNPGRKEFKNPGRKESPTETVNLQRG
jgi:RimJ/RimL family protein N-acetyltransferase